MFRSMLAILAGYFAFAAGIMIVFGLIMVASPGSLPRPGEGRSPAPPVMAAIVAADAALAVLAGFTTAAVAGRKFIVHAAILGAAMVAMATIAMISQSGGEPAWYRAIHLALPLPATTLGGWLCARWPRAAVGAVGV